MRLTLHNSLRRSGAASLVSTSATQCILQDSRRIARFEMIREPRGQMLGVDWVSDDNLRQQDVGRLTEPRPQDPWADSDRKPAFHRIDMPPDPTPSLRVEQP
jgi:hypothetical protein